MIVLKYCKTAKRFAVLQSSNSVFIAIKLAQKFYVHLNYYLYNDFGSEYNAIRIGCNGNGSAITYLGKCYNGFGSIIYFI